MKSLKQIIKHGLGIDSILEKRSYDRIVDCRALPLKERVEKMMDKYERLVGYRMDINNPRLFTEKLQWYKAFYVGDGHLERVVDKYLFKQYIQEKLGDGYTVPLFGAWEDIDDLIRDWEKLPEEFCLKSTVQSEGKCIEFIHNKSQVDLKKKAKEWSKWLLWKRTLVNGYTQAYRNCKPRIIAEQYLENIKDQLFDYKFYCFNGDPFCCCVNTQHFEKGKEHTFPITYYDLNWNKINVQSGIHETEECVKPKHFEEMIEISKKLSKGFPHIRVDFFDTDEKLYLSELTLYSGGGYFKYNPESFNIQMGDLFILPEKEIAKE